MSVLPLLDDHKGCHHARYGIPRRTLAEVIRDFLRPLRRAAEEERAAPQPPQGAALLEVPDTWTAATARDGLAVLVPPVPVNGRYLGTQPRRQLDVHARRPGKQPWDTMAMPLLYEPEPDGPSRAWDPGGGLGPLAPPARPYVGYPCCGHCGDELDHLYHETPCDEGCNG